MVSFGITLTVSVVVFIVFTIFQIYYFKSTKKYRDIFKTFFDKNKNYSYRLSGNIDEYYPQIDYVGEEKSSLNSLIKEINTYLFKTKGTSDYEYIRNKVERRLSMLNDQSTVHLAFPTYIGLMGTFLGVFIGILTFLCGISDVNSITDTAIKNLLSGVLVSMATSLVGLFLTTINNHLAGEARKKVEEDKNEFYDFIQTEITKTASASLVIAITRLHDTVDKFEPAFNRVIDRFQNTFDNCTRAFGDNFEKHVTTVADAVNVMGENMDKINYNIDLQQKLLDTLKTGEINKGLDKYIEAANHFVSITQSLNKFEEARRMMLAAAQEAIAIQNQYADSLQIPREVAVRINQILDRIKDFEKGVNEVGRSLERQDILSDMLIKQIGQQVNGISHKGKIASKYFEIADGKLEDLYTQQTKVIDELNKRYKDSIESHIDGFEKMLAEHTQELNNRHSKFVEELQSKFNIEEIRSEFSNLKKINDILSQLQGMSGDRVKSEDLKKTLDGIKNELVKIEKKTSESNAEETNKKSGWPFWGNNR